MSDRLRRIYNQIDRAFDRSALTEVAEARFPITGLQDPLTCRHALEEVLPKARTFDGSAVLKMAASEPGLQPGGLSFMWEFFFDLPKRRAKLACQLKIGDGPSTTREPGDALYFRATPFPAVNSPFRAMATEGKLLHRQLIGQWNAERRRTPDMPARFRDSDVVYEHLLRAGLDPQMDEHSFSSGVREDGRLGWQAQTRRQTFWVDL